MITLTHAPGLAPTLSTDSAVERLLSLGAPVAIGVSGGKDSAAVGHATNAYLTQMGHTGKRILIHSDLGRVEWKDSLPSCQRLADALGLELVTVRRKAGDLVDRWQKRWTDNVQRYADLSCARLILPWSTPSMRFCTSEMKTTVICRYLVERFAGQRIVSVNGIRREESAQRAKAPISAEQKRLASKTYNTSGIDWHAILSWTLPEVWAYLKACGTVLHEAYTVWNASRVSCVFCIMSAMRDLAAGARCPDNAALYRLLVDLEVVSTFGFQGSRWLGDVAPDLLSDVTRERLIAAKKAAARREAAEARIPKRLLFGKGWPTCIPTPDEARLLCEVRAEVADAVGISVGFTCPDALIGRYTDLYDEARAKARAKAKAQARTRAKA